MGEGRFAAKSKSARPAGMEPVKPTAFTSGCFTRAAPTEKPESKSKEKTPSGKSQARTLSRMMRPTSSLVPGWAGCALTMTGFPAAKAETVIPTGGEKGGWKIAAPESTQRAKGGKNEPKVRFGGGFGFG